MFSDFYMFIDVKYCLPIKHYLYKYQYKYSLFMYCLIFLIAITLFCQGKSFSAVGEILI